MTSVDYFVPDAEAHTSPHLIATYLETYSTIDDLVVDPFCQSSETVVEAFRLGRRVIAISFNPLDALRSRLALLPVPKRELDAALTTLSDSPKLEVPLRAHLQRLYRATCRQCKNEIIADYFVWERRQDAPQQVSYHCPRCADAGVRDCDESDQQGLREVKSRGLHYWYVLDRVARREDEARRYAVHLLELYTPRALYVLANIVLKVEDLFAGSLLHDYLRLALLRCLQLGSKLNPAPGEPSPPSSGLRPPSRFAEWNVWKLFEDAMQQLRKQDPQSIVPLAAAAAEVITPPSRNSGTGSGTQVKAFVGHASVRQLSGQLPPRSVKLILSQPPQLGRARWALPYLWTGWLFGHEEAALLWPLVRRRASDWPWYLRAMNATLSALRRALCQEGHVFLTGGDRRPAYLESLTLAAAGADLRLETALYRPSKSALAAEPFAGLPGDYRLVWTPSAPTPPWPMTTEQVAARVRDIAAQAAEDVLRQRGEPAPFSLLHCRIWQALSTQGVLQRIVSDPGVTSPLDFVREHVRTALESGLQRTFTQSADDEAGGYLWWLVQPPEVVPLSERVEQVVRETLETAPPVDRIDFVTKVNRVLPDSLTPDEQWVGACLESYGRQDESGAWTLREEERKEHRAAARQEVVRLVDELGQRLGYTVTFETPSCDVLWAHPEREDVAFVVLDSAALSRLLTGPGTDSGLPIHRLAIISEARQSLLRLRLRSASLRSRIAEIGWRFARDVDLAELAHQEEVTLADLDSLLGLDPFSIQDRTQLSLI